MRILKKITKFIIPVKLKPKSIYTRLLLIFLLPMILVQVTGIYVFYERHWRSMSRNLVNSFVKEIHLSIDEIAKDEKEGVKIAKKYLFVDVDVLSDFPNKKFLPQSEFKDLRRALDRSVLNYYKIALSENKKNLILYIGLSEKVLAITASTKNIENSTTYIYVMWLLGSAIVLSIIALIFLSGQIKSILKLTHLAENFGHNKDIDKKEMSPQGAMEVRRAIIAFIEMQERIKHLLRKRDSMVNSVLSELKAPFVRIKLELENLRSTDEVKKIKDEIKKVENILEGYENDNS